MSEVDLAGPVFAVEVDLKPIPIDCKVYEESQNGVQRLIWRMERKRKKIYDPLELGELNRKIERLEDILDDLQKALER